MSAVSLWLICALAALIAEFLTGTFYLLAVAIAIACGALAAWLGFGLIPQLMVASVCGVIGVGALARYKRRLQRPQPPADPDLGQSVHIDSLPRPGFARVHYRGAQWDAKLLDPELQPGADAYIVGKDGNLLKISATQPKA